VPEEVTEVVPGMQLAAVLLAGDPAGALLAAEALTAVGVPLAAGDV
jgi:hypothetical protein